MNRIYPSFNGGSLEIAPTLPLNSELGPEAEKLKGGGDSDPSHLQLVRTNVGNKYL